MQWTISVAIAVDIRDTDTALYVCARGPRPRNFAVQLLPLWHHMIHIVSACYVRGKRNVWSDAFD